MTRGRVEHDKGRVEHVKGRVEHDKGRVKNDMGRWAVHTVGQHTQEVRTLEAALLKWNPLTQRIPSTTNVSTYLQQ